MDEFIILIFELLKRLVPVLSKSLLLTLIEIFLILFAFKFEVALILYFC